MHGIDLSELEYDALNALQKDLEKEFKKREKQRRKEAMNELKEVARKFNMPLEEIVPPQVKASKRGSLPQQKYQHPDDPSKTWSGRGRRPRWINDLLAEGYDLEDLVAK